MGMMLPPRAAASVALTSLASALHCELRGLAGEINSLFEGRTESSLPDRLGVMQRAAMYAGFWGVGVYLGSLVELAEQVLKLNAAESNSSDRGERAKVFSSGCNTVSAYLRDLAAGSVVSYMELNQAFGTVVRRARPMLLNLDAQQVSDLLYMAVPPTLELASDWMASESASHEALHEAVTTALLAGVPDVDAAQALTVCNPYPGYAGLFEAILAVSQQWDSVDPSRQSLIHKDIQKQLGTIQVDLAERGSLVPAFPDPFMFSALMAAVADIEEPGPTASALKRKYGLVASGKAGALNQVARTFMQVLEKAVSNMAQAARTQTPKAAQRDAQELARNAAQLPSKAFGLFAHRLDAVCLPWKERAATEAEWTYAMAMLCMMRLAAATWGHQESQDELLEYAQSLTENLDLAPSKTVQATVRADGVSKLLKMMGKDADRVAHLIAEPLSHLQSGQASADSAGMAVDTVGLAAGASLRKIASQLDLLMLPVASGCARRLALALADREAWGQPAHCHWMVDAISGLRVCLGRLRPSSMLDMEPVLLPEASIEQQVEGAPVAVAEALEPSIGLEDCPEAISEVVPQAESPEQLHHEDAVAVLEPALSKAAIELPEDLVTGEPGVFASMELGEPIFDQLPPEMGADLAMDGEEPLGVEAGPVEPVSCEHEVSVDGSAQEAEPAASAVPFEHPDDADLEVAIASAVGEELAVEATQPVAPTLADLEGLISSDHIDNSPEHLAGLITLAATGPDESLQGDDVLLTIFEEEATGALSGINAALETAGIEGQDEVVSEIRRLVHTLKGGCRTCGLGVVGSILHEIESAMEMIDDDNAALAPYVHVITWAMGEVSKRIAQAFAELASKAVAASSDHALTAAAVLVEQRGPAEFAGDQQQAELVAMVPTAAAKAKPQHQGGTVRIPVSVANEVGQVSGTLLAATRDSVERFAQVETLLGGLGGLVDRIRPIAQDLKLIAQSSSVGAGAAGGSGGFDEIELERSTALQDLVLRLTEAIDDIAGTSGALNEAVRVARRGEDDLAQVAVDLQRRSSELLLVPVDVQRVRLESVLKLASTDAGKEAELVVDRAARVPSAVLDKLMPALEHLIRNTVAHGIEPPDQRVAAGKTAIGTVKIGVPRGGKVEGGLVRIAVRDDGAGLDLDRIRERAIERGLLDPKASASPAQLADLIFSPGFSTAQNVTQLSGRGVGLDVVRSTMTAIGGSVFVRFRENYGTEFVLTIPADSSSMTVIPVEAGGYHCMVPASLVSTILPLAGTSNLSVDWAAGVVRRNGLSCPLRDLRLHVPGRLPASVPRRGHLLFMQGAAGLQVVFVDAIRPQQRVLTKALGIGLNETPGLLAATQAASTGVSLVVNPLELPMLEGDDGSAGSGNDVDKPSRTVLVVDDSATVRLATARLLESFGFDVRSAVHGQDALDQMAAGLAPSAILCDLEMPVLNGYELLRELKADAMLASVPVVVISSRSTHKHQSQALELGAAAYMSKPVDDFELRRILDTAISK